MASESKKWGVEDFWGLSYDHDPQWILDEEQKAIQKELMEVCRTVIRPQAEVSDRTYEFPRKSIDALASLRLLGLIVPKELGGRGQNHVCVTMVTETIARYGCPSTAMIFVMHQVAVANLLLHHHGNQQFKDLLKRLDEDVLLGTCVYSDSTTGGHNWFAMSSKTKLLPDGCFQLLRYCSWTTSAGFADFYTVEVTSPNFGGNYMNESVFLMYKDEIRSSSTEWSALGMRGNQSAPTICEAVLTPDRLIGPIGDFPYSGAEVINPYFLLLSSACWNGIALGCIDITRNHVTNKRHFDRGMRIGDYPIIQDYIGGAIADTNACRMLLYSIAQGLDQVTNNSDWAIYSNPSQPVFRRALLGHWCFQVKIKAAANVNDVSDKMMNACGGTGYKSDLGLERLLRDGRAGWVMGTTNELLRQMLGQAALYGIQSLDLWSQKVNHQSLNVELRKLSDEDKLILAEKLVKEVRMRDSRDSNSQLSVDESDGNDGKVKNSVNDITDADENNNICIKLSNTERALEETSYQDTEFDNPFNTSPPATPGPFMSDDGMWHYPALKPDCYTPLKLTSVIQLNAQQTQYEFALPHPTDYTGCTPGQYIKVRIGQGGVDTKHCERFFSPVSATTEFGKIALMLKYETNGELTKRFQALEIGDAVEFKGPCGGFEYIPNSVEHLSLLSSGSGCAPFIQIIRDVFQGQEDQTKISVLHYSDLEGEIPYKREMETLASGNRKLNLFYSVGKAVCPEEWKGGIGYLSSKMLSDRLPPPVVKSHKILICGGPSMVCNVLQDLFDLGYSSDNIFVYGQFGAEQVRTVYGRHTKLSSHKPEDTNIFAAALANKKKLPNLGLKGIKASVELLVGHANA